MIRFNMFSNLILLGLAGGSGTILRYLVQKKLNAGFPLGTLAVNIAGCLLIGLLWGYFSKNLHEVKQLILITGFCGGFTTFSAFTGEGIQMMMEDRWFHFFIYTAASVVLGLLATYAGLKIMTT
jgi:fluoride exporter